MQSLDKRFYLGVQGELLAMPVPEAVDRTKSAIKGVSTSIDGTQTVNTTGGKRTWSMEYQKLTSVDISNLITFFNGVAWPLRLIDPRSTNMLSARASSTHSAWGSKNEFTTSAVTTFATPTSVTGTFPLSPKHRTFIRGSNSAGVAGNIFIGGWVPMLPSIPVTLSAWTRFAGTGNLVLQTMDSAGAVTTLGTTSVASNASWNQQTVVATTASTTVAVRPYYSVPASGINQDISAVQLERGGPSDWVLGAGVPYVDILELPESIPEYFVTDTTVKLIEL